VDAAVPPHKLCFCGFIKEEYLLMGCGSGKGCCRGGCGGCCSSSAVDIGEPAINSIAELEIYYSETDEGAVEAYTFESLYCISNIQTRELVVTGLEGSRYAELDTIRQQVIDCLTKTAISSGEEYRLAEVSYISK
jgi:hypothetical protein